MSANSKNIMRNSNQNRLETESRIEAIRHLKLETALQRYGIEFDRNGFARCPFHSERTASFKVHNNKYKCFGCGASGDLIDFVMNHFGMPFHAAVDAICRDFGIHAKPTIADQRRLDAVKLLKAREKREYRRLLDKKLTLHDMYLRACELRDTAAKAGKSPSNEPCLAATFTAEDIAVLLEEAEAECIEYAKEHPDVLPIAPNIKDWPTLEWNKEAIAEMRRAIVINSLKR